MQLKSKADAQRRADQIGHFQAELEIIEQENILSLNDIQRSALANYQVAGRSWLRDGLRDVP